MGEFIDPISSGGSFGLLSSLVGAAALGIYALLQDDSQNDDGRLQPRWWFDATGCLSRTVFGSQSYLVKTITQSGDGFFYAPSEGG